jgi:hypothetical protein
MGWWRSDDCLEINRKGRQGRDVGKNLFIESIGLRSELKRSHFGGYRSFASLVSFAVKEFWLNTERRLLSALVE